MTNLKSIRKEVREYAESRPGREISFGLIIGTVGTKYVHIQNLHRSSTFVKVPLDIFYLGKIEGVNKYQEQLSDYI